MRHKNLSIQQLFEWLARIDLPRCSTLIRRSQMIA